MEYFHNWMKYSHQDDPSESEQELKLTQKIYKLAHEAGYIDFVMKDDGGDDFYTTRKWDEELDGIIENYNCAID